MTTQSNTFGALAVLEALQQEGRRRIESLPALSSRRSVAEAVLAAIRTVDPGATGLPLEIQSAVDRLPILATRKTAGALIDAALASAKSRPATPPPSAAVSALPTDLRARIEQLPSLSATAPFAPASPAPAPAARFAAPAPAPAPRPPAPTPEPPRQQSAPMVEKSVAGAGLPVTISALAPEVAASELALIGIKTWQPDGRGDRVSGYPTADLSRVYRLTSGPSVVFSSRSPNFTLAVHKEANTRPLLQRPENPIRLRDILPADLQDAAAKASNDIVAALNAPYQVLDRLKVSGSFDGHNLEFKITAGPADKYSFSTGHPDEAALVFAECKASGTACQVVAKHHNAEFVWLKTGLNERETIREAAAARAAEATRAEAAALRAEADRVEASRRR